MDGFNEALSTFEAWVENMAVSRVDERRPTQIVYGLVVVGVFLQGNRMFEPHRSDLVGIYGLDWFTLDREAWRETKDSIYANTRSLSA